MKSKWLISVGLAVCLVLIFALPMCVPTPAPPVEEEKPPVEEEAPPVEEPELANYVRTLLGSSAGEAKSVAIAEFIKEELGVELINHYSSCGEIEARLRVEAPRFSADMTLCSCSPQGFLCKTNEWTVPYDSPEWRDAGLFKDPDNHWFDLGKYSFVVVGNKQMLAEKGYTMPESWDDLLDPKWKGQIVMPSPVTSGTGYMIVSSFLTLYGLNAGKGEEGGWEYLTALDKNIDHYVRGGNTGSDLVGRGEFMLAISSSSGVGFRIEKGYPIGWACPKEGTGYDDSQAMILKGTEELYTCQKIIDALGTEEFAERWVQAAGHRTKAGAAGILQEITYIPNIDLKWTFENKARLLDEWKEKFLVV